MPTKLKASDYEAAAKALGVDVASVRAVTEVESRGSGFLPSGEPVILFERHIMKRMLDEKGIKATNVPDVVNASPGGYKGGQAEHERLARAVKIDRNSALKSASWGLFQIMGFNYSVCGYASLQSFINAQYRDEASQLDTFVRFVKANPSMWKALRERNWVAFARAYNGPGYAAHNYHGRLKDSYVKFKNMGY